MAECKGTLQQDGNRFYCDLCGHEAFTEIRKRKRQPKPTPDAALTSAVGLLKPIIDQVINVVAASPEDSCGWGRFQAQFGGDDVYPIRDEIVNTLQKVKAAIDAATGE